MILKKYYFDHNYWNNKEKKEAFKTFAKNIFNLDFSKWEKYGYWDDDYIPFSLFDGDRIVSSVCVYKLNVILNGIKKNIYQISAVGTLPEYRRRGYSRFLIDKANEILNLDNEFVFLFSDDEAVDFYNKLGFIPDSEYFIKTESNDFKIKNRSRIRKLTIKDLKMIESKIKASLPVSDYFALRQVKLHMFHVLYTLIDKLYYIEDLDVILAFSVNDDWLTVYDIISNKKVSFKEIEKYLNGFSYKNVIFRFYTDKLDQEKYSYVELKGNNLFTKGKIDLKDKLVFPYIIQA